MKAKTILRISLFAALLCMITILSAFAAEDTAKIFRFDGMGTLPADFYNIDKYAHRITSDGTLRIELKKSDLGSYGSDGKFASSTIQPYFRFNTYGAELNFSLNEYSYAKIKYRTNYTGKMQFYIGVPNEKSTNGNGYIYFEQGSVGSTTTWQTKELHYDSTDNPYNGNKLQCTEKTGYFPTTEKDIPVGNSNKPFFQFKDITEANYKKFSDTDIIYIEIEYIAFFKNSEDMSAYTGNDNTEHAKILAWDGSQNVKFTTGTSPKALTDESKMFSIDDGYLKIDMKAEYLNNPELYEYNSSNKKYTGSVCFQPLFTIDTASRFNLQSYPYVKVKMKTDYPEKIQFYNPGTNSRVDFNGKIDNHLGKTVTAEFNYKDSTKNYITDGITWNINAFGNNSVTVSDLRFQFKSLTTGTYSETSECNNPTDKSYTAEIYYIAYFDTEKAMLAYDSDESNAVDKAVETILKAGAATDFQLIAHPGVTEDYIADYVATKAQGMVEDVTVTAEYNTAYKYYYNVLVTVKSGDISKTIGVNVRIKSTLADITPTVKGAQIRTDNRGLRFGFVYSADTTGYADVKYGALLAGETAVGATEITLENVGDSEIIRDCPAEKIYDETEHIYTAVVTEIPEGQETTKVVAVPYVTYKVGEETFIVYGNKITRSIKQVEDIIDSWSTGDIAD